jgi:dTMP kinase
MRGKFITFEGGEGSGKSTQVSLLATQLTQAGHRVVTTREPGGSAFAERIRGLLLETCRATGTALAEALLFNAARADHLAATIKPALARGDWVISDRFMDSTRAYQGAGGALAASDIDALEALVVAADRPDLTIVLDLDPREGLDRARRRHATGEAVAGERDPFEARELAFHARLRQGFLDIAAREPRRCAVLDAAEPPDAIAAAVRALVAARLGGS